VGAARTVRALTAACLLRCPAPGRAVHASPRQRRRAAPGRRRSCRRLARSNAGRSCRGVGLLGATVGAALWASQQSKMDFREQTPLILPHRPLPGVSSGLTRAHDDTAHVGRRFLACDRRAPLQSCGFRPVRQTAVHRTGAPFHPLLSGADELCSHRHRHRHSHSRCGHCPSAAAPARRGTARAAARAAPGRRKVRQLVSPRRAHLPARSAPARAVVLGAVRKRRRSLTAPRGSQLDDHICAIPFRARVRLGGRGCAGAPVGRSVARGLPRSRWGRRRRGLARRR